MFGPDETSAAAPRDWAAAYLRGAGHDGQSLAVPAALAVSAALMVSHLRALAARPAWAWAWNPQASRSPATSWSVSLFSRCMAGRPACRAPARGRVPQAEGHTNISSAVSDGLLSADMLSEADRRFELLDQAAWLAMAGSRNGLRESGRGGGSSKGEAGLCDAVGDTALLRLRKGLFEGRLRSNSAGRRSKWQTSPPVSKINQALGNRFGPRAAPCMRMTTVIREHETVISWT